MKIEVLSRTAVALVLLGAFFGPANIASLAFSSGPPSGFTSAPGESNCTACHTSFPLDSGAAAFDVTAPLGYAPGSAQLVAVAFQNTTTPRHGFQITARDGAGNPTGAWQAVQIGVTKNASGSAFHHEHTSTGAYQSAWTMNWIAPLSLPNGPVTFYSAGVEGDGSGNSGDYVYTATRKLYQATLATPGTTWAMATPHTITLSAPNHGGELFCIVPSEDPTPFSFGGPFLLEDNPTTGLLDLALQLTAVFDNILGTLDASGQATATVTIPYFPSLIGFQLHFAGITADAMLNPTEVSNRVTITVQ